MDSQLQGVDFVQSELKNSMIVNCDLLDAIFDNTNMEKADFRDSRNYNIDPEINNVKHAKFSMPDVIGLLNKYNLKIDS